MQKKYGNITRNGFMNLNKRHVQLFMKRLRKITERRIRDAAKKQYPNIKKSKIKINAGIRYYIAGEYGSHDSRPHYHCILFGAEQQDVIEAWIHPETKKQIGYIDFGYDCSEKAIGYTLKYICKEPTTGKFGRDDRLPEFALMSKGLGNNYLTPEMIAWHKANLDERVFVPLKDGKKAPMPRYYKNKIYNSEEWGYLKGVLERRGLEEEQEKIRKYPNYVQRLVQSHLASFRQMYHKERQGRSL